MTHDDPYATPQRVTELGDCYFYHTMEVPGYGLQIGEWDLRPGISDYLGHAACDGKRVLELGTASGYVGFHLESLGAEVVAVDLSERQVWDVVPFAGVDCSAILGARRAHSRRLNNAFWLAHRALGSRARVVYSTVYDLPAASIGPVDITVFGAILLHIRDPWLALERAAAMTRETIVVADLAPDDGRELAFLPDRSHPDMTETWWRLSPEVVARYLAVLGFRNAAITRHTQRHVGIPQTTLGVPNENAAAVAETPGAESGTPISFFTVHARRDVPFMAR